MNESRIQMFRNNFRERITPFEIALAFSMMMGLWMFSCREKPSPIQNWTSADKLDSLLSAVMADSITGDSLTGANECTGDSLHPFTLRNGIVWNQLVGGKEIQFKESSFGWLGLVSPFSEPQWIKRFGVSNQSDSASAIYISDQNIPSQLDYFEHRFEIHLILINQVIQSVSIREHFDDC